MLSTDVPARTTVRKNRNVEGNLTISNNLLSSMQSGNVKWKKENAPKRYIVYRRTTGDNIIRNNTGNYNKRVLNDFTNVYQQSSRCSINNKHEVCILTL